MIKSSNIGGGVGSNDKKKRGYRRPTNIVTDKDFNRISTPAFFVDPPSTYKLITPKGNMPIRSRMEIEHPLKNPNAVATPNTIPPQLAPYIPADHPMQNIVRITKQLSVSLPASLGLTFNVIPDSVLSADTMPPSNIAVLPHPQHMPPSPAQVTNADIPTTSINSRNDVILTTVSASGEPVTGAHSFATIKLSTQIGVGKLDHYDVFSKVTTVALEPPLHLVLNIGDLFTLTDEVNFVEERVTLADVLAVGETFGENVDSIFIVLGKNLRLADALHIQNDGVLVLLQIEVNLKITLDDSMAFWLDGIQSFVVQITPLTLTVSDTIANWLDAVFFPPISGVESLHLGDAIGSWVIINHLNVSMPTDLVPSPSYWLGPIDVFAIDPVNPYIFAGTAVLKN